VRAAATACESDAPVHLRGACRPRQRRDGPGHWRDGPGHWRDGPEHWEDGPGHWEDGPGHWEDGPGHWRDGQGHWRDGPGHWKDGPGHWEDGPGHWKDGPGHWEDRYLLNSMEAAMTAPGMGSTTISASKGISACRDGDGDKTSILNLDQYPIKLKPVYLI
jgi:hypothetical protein